MGSTSGLYFPLRLLTEGRKTTEANGFSDRHRGSRDGIFGIRLGGAARGSARGERFTQCLIASSVVNEC